MKTIMLTIIAVLIYFNTVFAFNEYSKYILKFNENVTQSQVYTIGMSIISAGQQFNIDPVLILGVMKSESHFKIFAHNKWDARGLMQIRVPIWFKTLKKEGFMKDWRDFYNPKKNTISGVYILAIYRKECQDIGKGMICMLQRYNGNRGSTRYYNKIMKAVSQYYELHNNRIKLKLTRSINNIEKSKLRDGTGFRLEIVKIFNASIGELAYLKAQI